MSTDKPDYLILGANGQVGRELTRAMQLLGRGRVLGRAECDLSKPGMAASVINDLCPKIVVNAAAWTAVDQAEEMVDQARRINADAVAEIARACVQQNAVLVHYSTDYVFAGAGDTAYRVDDDVAPQSVYGQTKLEGERAIAAAGTRALILRTSWVYAAHGHNFVRTMLRLGRERDHLKVINDQIGAPTWAATIADATALALHGWRQRDWDERDAGLYHLTSSGAVSWHGLAVAVFEEAAALGLMEPSQIPHVEAIPSSDYPQPAPRPGNSRLDTSVFEDTFGLRLPCWRDALRTCLRSFKD
ncbi:dTDP-4-dehydrorhamnose reductase [Kushneria sp. Sum13]|uniref:dTDP-4-dehydrorhamnose reductase n=1 Tax=Kushneria sp. Sum13 TaxID=3459196 RepID=UPI0040460FB9